MFDTEYSFWGIHAKYVMDLTSVLDDASKLRLFNRNIDVYLNAPLIGFLYGRTAEEDKTPIPDSTATYQRKIDFKQIQSYYDELVYNWRIIMLLDKGHEPDTEKRINKALRHFGKYPEDNELYEKYVRGGVEVLYEKLMEGAFSNDDYMERLYEFSKELQERFNEDIDIEEVRELCLSK